MNARTARLLRTHAALHRGRHRALKRAWNQIPRPHRAFARKHIAALCESPDPAS